MSSPFLFFGPRVVIRQSFTHSQYMNNSAANMEMNLREVIMREMDVVKSSLLGMDGGNQDE